MGKIFNKLNIDYCIGGSIAGNFYREPRSTKDVDINVYTRNVRKSEWITFIESLGLDEASVIDFRSKEFANFSYLLAFGRIPASGIGIVLFPPTDGHRISQVYDIALKESKEVETDDGSAMIQSKTSIILFKLGFNRPKDWDDIIEMIRYNDDPSWTVAARGQIVSIFGPDSLQLERWDKLYSQATADQV